MHGGHIGAQFAQGFDGFACAAHRIGFQGAAEGEEKEQQGAFHPLVDCGRAQRSGDHQEVDIEAALLGLLPGADDAGIAASHKGDETAGDPGPVGQRANHLAANPADQQRDQGNRGQDELIILLPEAN